LVKNTGTITAEGGTIALTAAAGRQIVDSLVQIEGELTAPTVTEHNGKIIIAGATNKNADNSPTVEIAGKINASGQNPGETGGAIHVTGNSIAVKKTARIDASGKAGGGEVLVGGDYKGGGYRGNLATPDLSQDSEAWGNTPGGYSAINGSQTGAFFAERYGDHPMPTASRLLVEGGAEIAASATDGHGGRVILWSDNATQYNGHVDVSSTGLAGQGGFVEVSGRDWLGYDGTVNTSALYGHTGSLLLDPRDLIIRLGADIGTTSSPNFNTAAGSGTSYLNITTLQTALNSASNVTIATSGGTGGSGNVTFQNALSWNSVRSLTVNATGSILLNSTITNAGTGSITLNAITSAIGDITINNAISTGGSITAIANRNLTVGANLTTGSAGGLSLKAAGGIVADAGTLALTGNLNVGSGALTLYSGSTGGVRPDWNATTTSLALSAANFGAIDIQGFNDITLTRAITSSSAINFANNNRTLLGNNLTSTASTTFANPVAIVGAVSPVITTSAINGDVTFQNALSWNSAQSLTVNATGGSIWLNNTISNTGSGGLSLTAGNQIGTLNAGSITTNGGNISFTATNGIVLAHTLDLNTNGGNLNFNNNLTLGANQNWNSGTGVISFGGTVNAALASSINSVQYLVVGGGGGGGQGDNNTGGGGGGGGGRVLEGTTEVSPGSISVVVGAGGLGGSDPSVTETTAVGGNSSFGASFIANGGGRGARLPPSGTQSGGNGGSGGGGFGRGASGGVTNQVPGFGSAGGNGEGSDSSDPGGGGGGGGAGGVGSNGVITTSTGSGGSGGAGRSNAIIGSAISYGGGGGGGRDGNKAGGAGGSASGGGGAGGAGGGSPNGASAIANRGGGGGGGAGAVGGTGSLGGAGGSGVVILRYTGTAGQALVSGGTATTVGGDTVWTFNNSGSFHTFAGGPVDLTLNGGSVSFGGAVGGTGALNNLSITSTNSLSLPSINAASITARTTGTTADITIPVGKVLTATGTGNAITLAAAGNFINNSGSSALSTPNGRWLVYSTNPASDTVGGLSNSFRRFSCTYGGSCPSFPATGNGLLYSFTPTLTITPTALASALTYGDAAPNLVGYAYGASGYLGSDATADTLSGSLTGTNSYSPGSNVGTYNINYSSGSLTSAMGYGFTYANNASAITVNPRVLTAALQGTVSKTYDRTTTASLAAGNYSLSNIYNSDDVTLNNPSAGTYDTANVGTGKTVSVTGLTLSGAKAANYTLAASAVNGTVGTITAKALTITANGKAMTYGDGNSFNGYSSSGLVAGDAISAVDLATNASLSGAGQWNAGSWLISAANATGTGLGNYSIAYNNGILSVGQKALTIAGLSGTNKVYDGTTTASLSGSASLSGVVGSDIVTLGGSASANFADKNVGTGKAITVAGYSLGGADLGNYSLSQPSGLTAAITAKALTITANGKAMTYGDGNSFNGYSSSGLVAGDAISAVDLATNASLSGAGQWNAGSWLISAANATGTGLGNYSIAYNNGTLTVGKRSLGGVVNNQTLTYGAATPSYGKNDVTWNAGDFYGSDDVASLTSATIDLGGYSQGSNAGSYTLAATGLSATNYQLGTVAPGILTVTGGTTDGDILPRPSIPNTVQWVTQNTFMMPTGSVDNAELMFTNQANDNQSTISSNGNSDESTMMQSNDNKKSKISYDALLMLNIDPLLAQNLGIKREFLKRFTMPGRKTQLNHNNLSETILAWAS
jgi:hypothetical protein